MASFPTPKVHRPSRRHLGRGQAVPIPQVVATLVASGSDVIVTFPVPMVIRDRLIINVAGGPTFVSQSVVSPTELIQVWSAPLSAMVWTMPGGSVDVVTHQGGTVAAATGTF